MREAIKRTDDAIDMLILCKVSWEMYNKFFNYSLSKIVFMYSRLHLPLDRNAFLIIREGRRSILSRVSSPKLFILHL